MVKYLVNFRGNNLDLVAAEKTITDVTPPLTFNGTTSSIQVILSETIGENDFTLNFKYKGTPLIYTTNYKVYSDGTNIIFTINNDSITLFAVDTEQHQVTITRASGIITAYVDGTKLTSTISYAGNISDKNFYIGTDTTNYTSCVYDDIQLISGFAATIINKGGYFKINSFAKVCNDWNKLSDDEKVALFENSNEATTDEIVSLGKCKILMYTKQKPQ